MYVYIYMVPPKNKNKTDVFEVATLLGQITLLWGEEAAGDERAWLRGRRGCKAVAGNGSGERAWKMVACQLAM